MSASELMSTACALTFATLLASTPQVSADDSPFTDLPFDAALRRAVDGERLLLVDVMTTWCPPCKRMEEVVWPDAEVVAWLDERAVAIQVDADEQRELVRSWGVDSYPTMLAWKDGELFDRTVGYVDADDLLDWLQHVEKLDAPLTEDDKLAALEQATDPFDPMERGSLADELLRAERYDDALRHYVWLWRESLDHDLAYVGVRRSFLIGDIGRLVSEHEPAREVFEMFFDEARMAAMNGDASAWADWRALGRLFDVTDDDVVEWYDRNRLDDGSLSSRFWMPEITNDVYGVLVDRRRWADAGAVLRGPKFEVAGRYAMHRALGLMTDDEHDELAEAREEAATVHAALTAAGRLDEAREVVDVALSIDDTPELRVALVDGLHVAGLAPERARSWIDHAGRRGLPVAGRLRRHESLVAIERGIDGVVPYEPFRRMTFDEAAAQARAQGRYLIVEVTASWYPPCRRMERETWPDVDVIDWLVDHAIAIQVDEDAAPEFVREHAVHSYPTVIAWADGVELDRVTGYRDARDMLRWFERLDEYGAPKIGDDHARLLEGWVTDADPAGRLRVAEELAAGHRLDAASRHVVWLWEHGADHDPSWSQARLTALLDVAADLADAHEPTRRAFEATLDDVELRVEGGDAEALTEWFALSGAFAPERVAAWVEEHGADHEWTAPQRTMLVDHFVESERWAEAGALVGEVDATLERVLAERRPRRIAELHAALVAAGRRADASRVADTFLAADDTPAARLALVEALFDALLAPDVALTWLDEVDAAGGPSTRARRRRHAAIRRDGY